MKLKRNKTGFSLIETIVAMAIVFIVSFCVYTTIAFASASLIQNKIINFAFNDIKSLSNILDSSGGIGGFSLTDFNQGVDWFYNNEADYTNPDLNNYVYTVRKDSNNTIDNSSNFKFEFLIVTSTESVSLFAKVYKNSSVIYELKNPYIKVLS